METRFSILALMLLSLLALQFTQHLSMSLQSMMRGEVQLIASGVGTEYLDEANTLDFDGIQSLDGTTQTNDIEIDGETFPFEMETGVQFMEKVNGAFVAATGTDPTDFQEVTVTIDGLLDTSVSMARIYYRAVPTN